MDPKGPKMCFHGFFSFVFQLFTGINFLVSRRITGMSTLRHPAQAIQVSKEQKYNRDTSGSAKTTGLPLWRFCTTLEHIGIFSKPRGSKSVMAFVGIGALGGHFWGLG